MNTLMDSWPRQHRITVDDYHRMAEAGLFGPEERVELIEGVIFDMVPIGPNHVGIVNRLTRLLVQAAQTAAVVQIQSSIILGEDSQPEPDIAVLAPRDDFYSTRTATAADQLLLIEVSNESLRHDLHRKLALYARHGVPEYWVVDVQNLRLHRFRKPEGERYTEHISTDNPGRTPIPALPGTEVDLTDLFKYLSRS